MSSVVGDSQISVILFSCDTFGRDLYLARCCPLKRTGTFASGSKVMFFFPTDFKK